MNIFNKTWKDPVGANVIGGLILITLTALITFLTQFPQKVIAWLMNTIIGSYEYWKENKTLFIIFIIIMVSLFLVGIIFNLMIRIGELSEDKSNKCIVGHEWLLTLNEQEFMRYNFLFWFPANSRLNTRDYDQPIGGRSIFGVSFDHIIEIRELLQKKILFFRPKNVLYFCLEIDSEVYRFLLKTIENNTNPEFRNGIIRLQRSDFCQLFQGTGYPI